MTWGYHFIVNAAKCNNYINDVNTVCRFIKTLIDAIEMYPIGKPVAVYVDTPEGKGVSAVQLITTSTITFHGDDEGKRIFVDVFSCKPYDKTVVLQVIQQYFNPKTINHQFFTRDV